MNPRIVRGGIKSASRARAHDRSSLTRIQPHGQARSDDVDAGPRWKSRPKLTSSRESAELRSPESSAAAGRTHLKKRPHEAGGGAGPSFKMMGRKLRKTAPEPLGPDHYGEIEEWLGYKFLDLAALERALTHRSALVHGKVDYEQLEFLGDAVLDLAVAHLLLKRHPESREGELSKMRAALVSAASLAEVARDFRLGRFVRLSWSELANGGAERGSILADVLEAVLGAVYQESGFESARLCIERILSARVDHINVRDPKTDLQEALHAAGIPIPVYRLECVEGPEHAPTFISVVEVEGEVVGRGRGPTKKASHQAAAAEALVNITAVSEEDESAATTVEGGDVVGRSEVPPVLESLRDTECMSEGTEGGECSAAVGGEHERDT